MAKIHEDFVILKISRVAKDNEELSGVVTDEMAITVAGLVEELIKEGGTDCVVELETGS